MEVKKQKNYTGDKFTIEFLVSEQREVPRRKYKNKTDYRYKKVD